MKTIYIVLTFCVGLFAGYLIFHKAGNTNSDIVVSDQTAVVELARINNQKVATEVMLKKWNNLLAGQLQIINKQLGESKVSLAKERQRIKTLQLQFTDNPAAQDTVFHQQLSQALDTLNAATDSVIVHYEQKAVAMDGIVAVRDSQLVNCHSAYDQLRVLSLEQIEREQRLTQDLNKALKQQKRRGIQNKVLAVGLVFISGFATTLFIKNKR